MNPKLKTALILAGTAAVVYVAYKKIPKLINPPKTGCNDKVCTGYPCKTLNDWQDSRFPPQNNLDDNGNPIYSNYCRYSRYRENPEYLTAWADAVIAKKDTFTVKTATGEDIVPGIYCTDSGNLVSNPNSGAINGVCPKMK